MKKALRAGFFDSRAWAGGAMLACGSMLEFEPWVAAEGLRSVGETALSDIVIRLVRVLL